MLESLTSDKTGRVEAHVNAKLSGSLTGENLLSTKTLVVVYLLLLTYVNTYIRK